MNGCRIEISSNDFYLFEECGKYERDINNPVFYPGNTIVGSLPPMEKIKILTPEIPLNKNKKGKLLPRKVNLHTLTKF